MAASWSSRPRGRLSFDRRFSNPSKYPPVRDFKPVPLRPAFLLFFMLYICTLIVLLEYACRTFPVAANRRDIPHDPTSEYGPFISVPIIHAEVSITASPSASSTSENVPGPAPSSSSSIPTAANGTKATGTSTAKTTSKSPAPTSWTDMVTGPMKLGDRLGYPGLDKPMNLVYGKPAASNITSNSTSNSTSPHRRAPPPENFGQIPGLVQLLGFEFWTTDAYSGDKSMWLRTDIFYTPWGRNIFVAGDEGSCQVVCDGPALVFLKPLCWSQWLAASQAEQAAMVQYPGAVRKINEQGLGGGVPCPKGPKAVVEPATTRSVEAEIVGVTTANGLPSTFTTTRPIPITAGASGFTLEPTVMRDSVGRPTATTSRWVISDLTLKDDKGNPTATVTARLRVTPTTITMVDVSGRPTATITTEVPLERSLVTLKDASGRPTATIATEVPLVTGLVTLTDANGVPVATVTGSGVSKVVPTGPRRTGRFDEPGLPSQQDTFHPISWGDYVLAAFVPVLVTVPLTILTQILRSEIRTLLPFNALTRQPNGATATESLCLNTGGIPGFVNSFRLLFRKEPLAFLGDLLMLSSAIIVSFSSEAFGIKLYGACTADNFQGCHMGIASFQTPSRVVQAFLSVALVALFIMMGLIRYWRTGVDSSGRSIAAIASLLGEKETQDVFRKIVSQPDSGEISNGEMIRQLDGRFFLLTSSPVSPAFGITTSHIPATARDEQTQPPGHEIRRRGTLPLLKVFSLSQSSDAISQVAFLLSVVSFFILIVYYESTTLDTAFERFMDSQHLGVRVLFTGVGVVLSLFWDDYFSQVSVKEPYRQLSRGPQLASNSILVSPPATAFTGLMPAAFRRDVFVMLVAFAAVLAKLTPILLANIPFSPWLTWPTHRACTWTAVGVLGFMIVTLVYGLVFVKYPYMPVHPGTLAGRIYYVCDSSMLSGIQGGELVIARTRSNRSAAGSGRRYTFGKMIGVSGETRIGIDYAHGAPPGEP